jgi:hypothetical protein
MRHGNGPVRSLVVADDKAEIVDHVDDHRPELSLVRGTAIDQPLIAFIGAQARPVVQTRLGGSWFDIAEVGKARAHALLKRRVRHLREEHSDSGALRRVLGIGRRHKACPTGVTSTRPFSVCKS